MPTNFLRTSTRSAAVNRPAARVPGSERRIVIRIGRRALRARLLETPTADRVWAALPLYSTAETWGESVHFETPIETGRDKTAKINGVPGEIYFWSEDDRIIVGYGPTPISRRGEMRLPRPCNVWALALDDAAVLKGVTPGEKVTVERVDR